MAEILQTIFLNPPIAIARLGDGTTPQEAYRWVQTPTPRSPGETTVKPDWTLVVQTDGSVEPVMPGQLNFRDGALIRPVCPFFELWALLGEPGSAPDTWHETPVTPALLTQHGAAPNDLLVRVDAQNLKAARRTFDPAMRFGTFPPVEVRGDNHAVAPLLAVSPPGVPAANRLIPAGRNIPLGALQVMRSRPQPAPGMTAWSAEVNVEIIRVRFTPARGRFYGPPDAATPHVPPGAATAFPLVEANRAFLNPGASWVGANAQDQAIDQPSDTYDGADVGTNVSLGVVDDTCEARLEFTLALPGGRTLAAHANVFVAPPDFAPDRRPFLSLADELNDCVGAAAARNAGLDAAQRDAWVEDLFERIYETVSLFNLDHWRAANAIQLTPGQQAATPIPLDGVPQPRRAMGGRDALRNRDFALPAVTANAPLPLTEHARARHRFLSDLEALRDLVLQKPERLAQLVRRPFEAEAGEGLRRTTMRMPPFMAQSTPATPLTLAAWQYDLLMAWVEAVKLTPIPLAGPLAAVAAAAPVPLSEAAAARRAAVLAHLGAGGQP
ncbi:MAG: hypothetical protein HYR56_10995 [Acidobacteria bacterium]|nr:hypothetical protein [Acidobacteriota bacterium]MBI3428309.1 hypothetical protein [Acidobacteriota bacterium]